MSEKKYQIFVSSTFRDLVEERQDAIRNILDLNHIPAGMELFPAADVDQLDYIKKVIDECDYYLLIMGGRYGSMDAEGVSYTEREYDYAVKSGKTVLAFVHNAPETIPVGKSEIDPGTLGALNAFRQKVMEGRLVRGWGNRQELEPMVLKALIHAFNTVPQVGRVRGDVVASGDLLEQSNRLLQENAALKKEIATLRPTVNIDTSQIADLDDFFELRYKYSRKVGNALRYFNATGRVSWRSIFLALAANLDKPKVKSIISTAVRQAAQEEKLDYSVDRLNDMDSATIKVQMTVLGLIRAQVSKTTQGGYEEFLSLTEKGQAQFMESMVVRKERPSPKD